eukprot:TRINITY_DN35588_c0_g1_i1.p2 TRINITY_DN35588_c0_g1~~TRINITY_DN35588_c0_g1_i1.p2  ORF type:complete len:230 (+),score=26.75 TRINITY_DN35588_c0_g1_i1:66-755(+)
MAGDWQSVRYNCIQLTRTRRTLLDKIAEAAHTPSAIRCARLLVELADEVTFVLPVLEKASMETLREAGHEQSADAKPFVKATRTLTDAIDLFLSNPTWMGEVGDSVAQLCTQRQRARVGRFVKVWLLGVLAGGLAPALLARTERNPRVGTSEEDMVEMNDTLLQFTRPVRERVAAEGRCPVCCEQLQQCRHDNDEPCAQCPLRCSECDHVMCRECCHDALCRTCGMPGL